MGGRPLVLELNFQCVKGTIASVQRITVGIDVCKEYSASQCTLSDSGVIEYRSVMFSLLKYCGEDPGGSFAYHVFLPSSSFQYLCAARDATTSIAFWDRETWKFCLALTSYDRVPVPWHQLPALDHALQKGLNIRPWMAPIILWTISMMIHLLTMA